MTDGPCQVAADTKLETPEGPLTIAAIARTPAAVLTRGNGGGVRFAMTSGATRLGEPRPVLRVTLAGGRSFRVGAGQVLFALEGREIEAGELKPGDELESVFAFPPGYVYRTDDGEEVASSGGVRVVSVEPAGEAELYGFSVRRTARFAFSAGVLGKAAGS
jgi:hypothetical protein